jgi:hypothetical protein
MSSQEIIAAQLKFFQEGKAGCQFAVLVSNNPGFYRWKHVVVDGTDVAKIDQITDGAIADSEINQLSLLFPQIKTRLALEELLNQFELSRVFYFEPEIGFEGYKCVRLRAKVLDKTSWVSGLGPFNFLPETRRAPYTELAFRVKAKPPYVKSVQPQTPDYQLHVANLELPGIGKDEFVKLWTGSFVRTREVLGHKPDLLSAAKTTFAIPISE